MKRVVLYIRKTYIIGGLETFIYNFCVHMYDKYDLTVVFGDAADWQVARLIPYVHMCVGNENPQIECDTLLMLRIGDPIPSNIKYKKVIRRIHTCKACGVTDIPHDGDVTVCISQAVKDDFGLGDEALVINNLSNVTAKPSLLLMSATRLPAPDKGKNEWRMRRLAEMMNAARIPFLWLNFSDGELPDAPPNFYNVGIRKNIQDYIQKADYLVQLSDQEAFGNSVLEALTLKTAVICTPIPAFKDFGLEDGVNAHVVPFDMEFDVMKLLQIPQFDFFYDNEKRIRQWEEIL